MNSSSTGKKNNVQYEKLEIDGEQVEEAAPDATLGVASSSSIGGADEVSERQPFRSFCYNCLGCISLRAGVLLMSLVILVETLRKLIVVARIWSPHTTEPKMRYPAVFILAAVQILYAFVGIVAASTKHPLAAKLFREACLIGALCEVPLWIMFCMITSTIQGDKVLVKLFVEVLFVCVWIYFCQRQVAFSFYKKCILQVEVEDVGQLDPRPITTV